MIIFSQSRKLTEEEIRLVNSEEFRKEKRENEIKIE